MINKETIRKVIKKSNIEKLIRKSLKEFPYWTTEHGKGTYAIGDRVYKRTKIPLSELNKGIAISIHTHGAKYPHSFDDVDVLRKDVLKGQLICQVVLSPELNHYFALYPNFTQANRDKLVNFFRLKPSQIKDMLLPKGMTTVTKEKNKLKRFSMEYGLSLVEGYY